MPDLGDDLGGKSEGGLVEQQQPRRGHQRPPDGEHLLLAPGQQAGALVTAVVQDREQLVNPCPGPRLGDAILAAESADAEVLVHRQPGEHLPTLGDLHHARADDGRRRTAVQPLAAELDRARVDPAAHATQAAGHRPEQGRLAGAVATEHGDDAGFWNLDRDVPDRAYRAAVADLETPHRQHAGQDGRVTTVTVAAGGDLPSGSLQPETASRRWPRRLPWRNMATWASPGQA